MNSKRLRAGHTIALGLLLSLLLTHPYGASSDPRSVAAPLTSAAAPDSGESCVHVVRRGESIGRIAARYGTTRRALTTANQLTHPEALRLGQRLEVPGCTLGRRVQAAAPSSEADRGSLSGRGDGERVLSRPVIPWLKRSADRLEFIWPVDGPVASGFGRRGSRGWHSGVDIKAPEGKPIHAAAGGTVVFSGRDSSYGRVIRIAHPAGFKTVYAHNFKNFVRAGERVEAGGVIGAVGRTGRATGDHLHFEIRRQGVAQNPLALLEHRQPGPMLATRHD